MKHGKAIGIVVLLAGMIGSGALVKAVWLKKYQEQKAQLALVRQEREQLHMFLELEQVGVEVSEYFAEQGIKSVAVLGMNREGRHLLGVLKREGKVSPVYGVEVENLGAVHKILTVYRLGDDPLPEADALVVCDLVEQEAKIKAVHIEFSGKIVTLSQVLDELFERHSMKKWKGSPRDI